MLARGLRLGGCDEAGRGPLAGPVVAACVVLPSPQPADGGIGRYVDSKSIGPRRRRQLAGQLRASGAAIGLGVVDPATIDRINILQASLLAMQRAVAAIGNPPDFLLIDGTVPIPSTIPQLTLIRGEGKSQAIAAASIIAKVERDRLMEALHQHYPDYNFAGHKGYPTREHRRALALHGPCPAHRLSFRGVRQDER